MHLPSPFHRFTSYILPLLLVLIATTAAGTIYTWNRSRLPRPSETAETVNEQGLLRTSDFLPNDSTSNAIMTPTPDTIQSSPAPTPSPSLDPFASLTIPFLRQRDYRSQLNTRQEYARNGNYTSYLTSYDSDGLRIDGLLTIPQGERPSQGWPAIVFVHGYIPPEQYQTTQRYDAYVDYLAQNGFVVFKIDLRGHGNSEGVASGTYYSGDYIIDTLNARAALAASDLTTEDRIGLWGHSMAGNIVLRSMTVAQNVPAGVIWAGSVYTYEDFSQFDIMDDSYQPPDEGSERDRKREQLRARHGAFSPDDPFWRQVPPTNYLDSVTGALQLHHARNDTVVPVGYSRNLDEILDDTTLSHERYEYETGGHNIQSPAFGTAMQRTVEFFNAQL